MSFTWCFVGHTHVPGAFVLAPDGRVGSVALPPGSPVRLRPDDRYIVNVGSVGQPRDFDSRSSYGIYDSETKEFSLVRVKYDFTITQKKIHDNDLPMFLAERLEKGR